MTQCKFYISMWKTVIHHNVEIYPTHVWTGTCIMSWCHSDVSKLSTLLKSNRRASQWSHLQSKVFNSQGLLTLLNPQIPETVFLSSCCSHLFISLRPHQILCGLRHHYLIDAVCKILLVQNLTSVLSQHNTESFVLVSNEGMVMSLILLCT